MMSAIQERVRIRLDRMVELETIYRVGHLTVAEARELIRLREHEAKRRFNRMWRNLGENAERQRAYAKQWRAANPGCW